MARKDQLQASREKIDAIDDEVIALISRRAELAKQIADLKRKEGAISYYRPEREAEVLRRVMTSNPGPLNNKEMAVLFRQIMSACLALEEPIKVAYLGPEGTFTQEATLKHFGQSVTTSPKLAIDEVFRDVEAESCDYGVVPVENSTEGIINQTLDSFIDSSLSICGEVELPIHQHFLVGVNAQDTKITRVYSHSQSLAQCRHWLDANYPKIERIAVSSNAEASKRAAGEWNTAAIAGEACSNLYELIKVSANIEDKPDNSTRFLIVGRKSIPPSGDDKTSVVVSVRNKPGALHTLLKPFHDKNIDLTRVETRPSKSGKWSYLFFIDFLGHREDLPVRKIFETLSDTNVNVRVLGSYPRAVI